MKQALLLLPLLACPDTWQPFALDQRVSVALPAQPTVTDLGKLGPGKPGGHVQLWLLHTPAGTYQFRRLPNPTVGVISLADSASRRAYYAQILAAVLRQEKGRLLRSAPFSTAAGFGMEYTYRGLRRSTGKRLVKCTRYLVVDSIDYSFDYLPADQASARDTAGAAQRRRFFDSITVKP